MLSRVSISSMLALVRPELYWIRETTNRSRLSLSATQLQLFCLFLLLVLFCNCCRCCCCFRGASSPVLVLSESEWHIPKMSTQLSSSSSSASTTTATMSSSNASNEQFRSTKRVSFYLCVRSNIQIIYRSSFHLSDNSGTNSSRRLARTCRSSVTGATFAPTRTVSRPRTPSSGSIGIWRAARISLICPWRDRTPSKSFRSS